MKKNLKSPTCHSGFTKGSIIKSPLALSFFSFLFSCQIQYNTLSETEYDTVEIPFLTGTLLNYNDTAFHHGTFGMYDYWDNLNREQNQPTGYNGYIHFSDTSYYKKTLGFSPYDLQSVYEIPIHIERGLIPYMQIHDKSIKSTKVFDNKIVFQTLNSHKWYTLKIYIIAKYQNW